MKPIVKLLLQRSIEKGDGGGEGGGKREVKIKRQCFDKVNKLQDN